MSRTRHPKKEIEKAIRHAESNGWGVEVGGCHAWGRIYFPYDDSGDFSVTSVWRTPKSPVLHARQIKRVVDDCATRRKISNVEK
jgi:hypothetical protein